MSLTRSHGADRTDRPAPSRGWAAVALVVFATAWGGNQFTPLLVLYRQTGQLSPVMVDTLLFTYVLGIVPALLIGGPLSDRLGRRPLMLPAPFIAAAGSLILAAGSDSAGLLSLGRVCSGVALGLSMAVGGSWIKELSDRQGAGVTTGARRAAMSLTAGFAVGAAVAAALAQWAPWPTVLPYTINIGLAVAAAALLLRVPETRVASADAPSLGSMLRIRGVSHRRFLFVVLPIAPWVFGAGAVAYAVVPDLMTEHTSSAPIAFAGLCSVVALGSGFAIQSLGRRLDDPAGVRGPVVAMFLVIGGLLLAALAAHLGSVWLGLAASTVLGGGYGLVLICGLLEVQRIAGPGDLAGLTAVYYGLTYLGFAVPAVLSAITERFPETTYPALLTFGALLAACCLAVVARANRSRAAGPLGQAGGRTIEVDIAQSAG